MAERIYNPTRSRRSAPATCTGERRGRDGPIVAAIIIVAGIAGIMKIMVLPALKEDKKTSVSQKLVPMEMDGAAK